MFESRPPPRSSPPGFGEPAPFFTAPTDGNPAYSIQVAAGRWMVLQAFISLAGEDERAQHDLVLARRGLFDDHRAVYFGVSVDPADRAERGLANAAVGLRYFWDDEQTACAALGLAGEGLPKTAVFLIDPAFRVLMAEPLEHTGQVLDRLKLELEREANTQDGGFAPVLTLPRIFEPEFCRLMIDYFEANNPQPSGFAKDIDGRTQLVVNPDLKRRDDVMVEFPQLVAAIEARLVHRLMPMIRTAFQWKADYIERFLITRYSASDRGFFVAHRDDVVAGAAHRKFALSINLNAEEFEGGDVRFPEFGRRTYRSPTGGGTVFSCSLLHEVLPVTKGVRYAFVPFLYDEAGEKIRLANQGLIGKA